MANKTREDHYKDIQYVLDHFDFKKVLDHMTLVDWKWVHPNGDMCIPSLEELRIAASVLLYQAADHSSEALSMGTGGFYVDKYPYGLRLSFNVTSRSSY